MALYFLYKQTGSIEMMIAKPISKAQHEKERIERADKFFNKIAKWSK